MRQIKILFWLGGILGPLIVLGALAGDSTRVSNEQAVTTESSVPTPVHEIKSVVEIETVPYAKRTQNDSSLDEGKTKIVIAGVNGTKTLTYEVTLTDGKQTAKKLIREEITVKPTAEVALIGTKKKAATRSCDPNYSGCVPIASDVDCSGGSGNGPAYVVGPIRVIGIDIYDLDRDGDGIACG